MKKIFFISAAFFVVTMIITTSACKKVDNTPAPTPMGTLMFHIHTNVDTTECDSGTIAVDATGRKFQLDIAQFYASGFVMHKTDGTVYNIPNVYILKVIATEPYYIAQVPAGNYTSVSFNVGVDPAANAMAPSSFAASSVLSAQTPNMWFGSTAHGYEFVNVQGIADTTATHTGPVNYPFSYQIGTNALLKTINLPSRPFVVIAGQQAFVHIIADYGVLLQGVNFKTQNMADPFTNLPVATQIANNIPNMFHYEM